MQATQNSVNKLKEIIVEEVLKAVEMKIAIISKHTMTKEW